MKIRYALNTLWPTDVATREGLEAVDWTKQGEMPFVPVAGMLIDCGDGDYREVRKVYWCADEPDEVEVFFEDETARPLSYWIQGGWQTDDFPMPAPAARNKREGGRKVTTEASSCP